MNVMDIKLWHLALETQILGVTIALFALAGHLLTTEDTRAANSSGAAIPVSTENSRFNEFVYLIIPFAITYGCVVVGLFWEWNDRPSFLFSIPMLWPNGVANDLLFVTVSAYLNVICLAAMVALAGPQGLFIPL